MRFAPVLQQQSAFDVQTSIDWHSLFFCEGDAFVAEAYSDTDSVTTWPNETGEADATEATNPPTYDAVHASFNNQPVVDFYAVGNQTLGTGSFSAAPSYTAGISLVLVGRFDDLAAAYYLTDGIASGNRNIIGIANSSGMKWRNYAGSTGYGSAADTNAHLWVATFDGSTGNDTVDIDGTSEIDTDVGSETITGLTIGSSYIPNAHMDGQIALLGIFEGDVTADAAWPDFIAWAEEHYDLNIFDSPGETFDVEADFAWHSLFWAEGTDFVAQGYSDTDTVGTWPNETGESDATEATNKPIYVASESGLNGQPAVNFDGSNDVLTTAAFGTNPTYPISIVLVVKPDNVTQVAALFDGIDTAARNSIVQNATPNWSVNFGTADQTGGTPTTDGHLLVAYVDTSTADSMDVDGVEVIAGSSGDDVITAAKLGNIFNDTFPWNGRMALCGIFEGDITQESNWRSFERWVTDHYGIHVA